MRTLLKQYFGFDGFRPLQEDIITHVLSGRDTCVIMPTGSGKSLCYQLPALALDGITLVISPLIALMKDQVDALRANGVQATCINSTLSPDAIRAILDEARAGMWKLIYVAPERLAMPAFQSTLRTLPIKLIAVDEAHCISEWGHDFRPDYRSLANLRALFPRVPWIALTATANARVQADIIVQLKLENSRTFLSSFNRPNLTYLVRPKKEWIGIVAQALETVRGSSAIIYCFSRKDTEDVAKKLSALGWAALPYHAGLDPEVRRRTQEKFIRDECSIIVATIAFGMGIDKPNVRLVVHVGLPRSVEGYYQETGRAGRDGLPSTCLLFYAPGDRWKREYFIRQIEDGHEQIRARQQLDQMIRYAEGNTCRRKYLLEYFGERWSDANCGGCDVCLGQGAGFLAPAEQAADYDKTLFEELRGLRKRLADERGIPAFVVFGDKTLREMARLYPQSLDSFRKIQGVGQEKERAFGTFFVAAICAYAKKHGPMPDLTNTVTERPKIERPKEAVTMTDTLAETKSGLEQRLSLKEIAQRRGLAETTILTHLEKILSIEAIDIAYLKPSGPRFDAIEKAFRSSGGFSLTPVRTKLGNNFSFEEIRLARLFIKK